MESTLLVSHDSASRGAAVAGESKIMTPRATASAIHSEDYSSPNSSTLGEEERLKTRTTCPLWYTSGKLGTGVEGTGQTYATWLDQAVSHAVGGENPQAQAKD